MKNPQKAYKIAAERLEQYISTHDMRPSKVRMLVLGHICQLPQPFTADELLEVCRKDLISVGTVYNTLNLFVAAQILHATIRQRGRAATEYELMAGSQVRMQIICQNCGRVAEIHDKAIERLVKERQYSNFNMDYFSLYVYGKCKLCRRKQSIKQQTEE